MSEKDIMKKAEGEETSDGKKLTLASIMREYDAKKAAAQKDEELESEELRAFKAEIDSMVKKSESVKAEDDYDDSDMKIASAVNEEVVHEDVDAADISDNRKLNIMNEISRHFENNEMKMKESRDAHEDNPVDEINVREDAVLSEESTTDVSDERVQTKEIPMSDDISESNESDENFAENSHKSKIDNSVLIEAFKDDGYDIYTGNTKKKKKKKQKYETDEIPVVEENTQNRETPESEVQPPVNKYDENGERIKKDNPCFKSDIEYTPESDTASVMTLMQKKLLSACLSMVAVFVIALFCIYTEFAPALGLPHIKALEPGKLGVVYILFDLQLMFFAAIFKLNSLAKGAVNIAYKTPTPESAAFVSVLAAAVHAIVTAATSAGGNTAALLCSTGCLSLLMLSVSDFFKARMEFMSFRIISSDGRKLAFKDLSDSDEETSDEIRKFVPEYSTILDSRQIKFADDFFARNAQPCTLDSGIGKTIIISLIIAVISACAYYFFNKSVYEAFCGFISVFLVSVQSCTLLSSTLPEYVYADRASKKKCAFIGHDLCDEYDDVSVVSFKDTEVFSPNDIKVTNIRTYGDTRIDNVIVTMARIFNKIGGPLSVVFSNSISGITIENEGIRIIDVAPDGLWLKVDGDNVYLGTATYMHENNFDTPSDVADSSFSHANGSILYLACANRILSKFYIKYTLNPGFESVLRKLYTQGICARIKTLDPCINNDFIRASLRRPECLFSVVKAQNPEEFDRSEERVSSGLVSASSENALIQSFLLIKNMRAAIKTNNGIRIIATVFGLALSALMLVGGSHIISPAIVLLLQIFWVIPIYVCTKLGSK